MHPASEWYALSRQGCQRVDHHSLWHWHRGGVCITCQSMAETAPVPAQRQAKRRHEATCVPEADSTVLGVKGATPLEALRLLKVALSDDPTAQGTWRSKARVVAVLGSCPRSRASLNSGGVAETALFGTRHFLRVHSGIRHWIQYIEVVHGVDKAHEVAFPPSIDDVLGWSNTFRRVTCSTR